MPNTVRRSADFYALTLRIAKGERPEVIPDLVALVDFADGAPFREGAVLAEESDRFGRPRFDWRDHVDVGVPYVAGIWPALPRFA